MRTTIKQQMAAVKQAMALQISLLGSDYCAKNKQWIALNDAYSTLASIALMESIKKKSLALS